MASQLQVLSNGTQFAIGIQHEGMDYPHILSTYPTQRKATNALKKIEKNDNLKFLAEWYTNSAGGSVMGSYFAGRFTEIIVSVPAKL